MPVPRPVAATGSAPVNAAISAAEAVVLAIPMSPATRHRTPLATRSRATSVPASTAATASARVIAGAVDRSAVPRRTLRSIKPGSAGSSVATPTSTTTTRAPTWAAKAFTPAPPARKFATISPVTSCGQGLTPWACTPWSAAKTATPVGSGIGGGQVPASPASWTETSSSTPSEPRGSLGVLEDVSVQLAGLAGTCPPPMPDPTGVAVFAADHGVHAQGVSPWPQEVTGEMVANFLAGGAGVNAFAAQVGARVVVVDVGVASELPALPGLMERNVRRGTADLSTAPAMTRAEAVAAVLAGTDVARDLVASGVRCLVAGDMGIANTTASAALIAAFTGADPAAAERVPLILDGVIVGAAALAAVALAPDAVGACLAGHRSAEPGHTIALQHLGLRPLVDLELRLGEGTGAVLAVPLVQCAVRALRDMATFDSAGVADKEG